MGIREKGQGRVSPTFHRVSQSYSRVLRMCPAGDRRLQLSGKRRLQLDPEGNCAVNRVDAQRREEVPIVSAAGRVGEYAEAEGVSGGNESRAAAGLHLL